MSRIWWPALALVGCNSGSSTLPTGDTATYTTSTGPTRIETILSLAGTANEGANEYNQQCVVCHPANGESNGYPALNEVVPTLTDVELVKVVVEGVSGPAGEVIMPDYAEYFTNQEIADLVAYMRASFNPAR